MKNQIVQQCPSPTPTNQIPSMLPASNSSAHGSLSYPNFAKKRLIVLSGTSNAGKTSTLNELARLLQQNAAFSRIGQPTPINSGPVDGQYAFSRLVNKTTQVIGISTAGDSPWCIDNGFHFFNKHHCDIGFIASKSKWSSVDRIEEICLLLNIKPRYLFLVTEFDQQRRTRSVIFRDVASDLFDQL